MHDRLPHPQRLARGSMGIVCGAMLLACTSMPVKQPAVPDNSTYAADLAFMLTINHEPEFLPYSREFVAWSNQRKLDSRGDCYRLLTESTSLMLIISAAGVIERATTSTDDAGARCFRASYLGQPVPRPPKGPYATRAMLSVRR